MTFNELLSAREWKMIPGCPGRYVLVEPEPFLTPENLAQTSRPAEEYRVKAARDAVLVLRLEGGGLISYRRPDGSFWHTLNDNPGLQRKLAQLGIPSAAGA